MAQGNIECYSGVQARWLAKGSSANRGSLEKAFPSGPTQLAASGERLGNPVGAPDQRLLPQCPVGQKHQGTSSLLRFGSEHLLLLKCGRKTHKWN